MLGQPTNAIENEQMEEKMPGENKGTAKELQDAAGKAAYEIFSLGFGLRISRRLEEGVEPEKTIGDLLVGVVEEELQDNMYGSIDILEAHRVRSPLTKNYSNLCRQALDLYIVHRYNGVGYGVNQERICLHATGGLMDAEGTWI